MVQDLSLGNSRDTSEFACDSLRHWWQQIGKLYYAFATSILLLQQIPIKPATKEPTEKAQSRCHNDETN